MIIEKRHKLYSYNMTISVFVLINDFLIALGCWYPLISFIWVWRHIFLCRIDPGAFHYMRNLKTLILDDNDWNFNANVDHPRVFNHSQLTTLSLNNAFAPLNTADKNSSEVCSFLWIYKHRFLANWLPILIREK